MFLQWSNTFRSGQKCYKTRKSRKISAKNRIKLLRKSEFPFLDTYPGFKVRPGAEPDLRFRFRFGPRPPKPEPNRTVASLRVGSKHLLVCAEGHVPAFEALESREHGKLVIESAPFLVLCVLVGS
jgi:hypothetical protein